jgi:purine-binding chemotaxis protein CheW
MSDAENKMQLVTFQLGKEFYGIDIMDVEGIVRVQDVRPIPNAPYFVEGIFNLRGDIIPVINLHKRFHLQNAELSDEDKLLSGFIIIRFDRMKMSIFIDKVSRVVTVKTDEIQSPPQMISGIGAEYINGVVHRESGYLIILDVRRIFNPKELKIIDEITN